MHIKIENGTTSSNLDLCQTCSNGHIQEFENGGVSKHCMRPEYQLLKVNQRVIRCNNYTPKTMPDASFKTAWTLRTIPNGIRVQDWPGMAHSHYERLSKGEDWKKLYEEGLTNEYDYDND